ncbi:hypothetical protein OSB04_013936 [Centaurea solstitialis]|uniref:Uncharacterized protein n=1 Tax=Centaurea solstitialis TaxID=347529 RepID=A0AA38WFX9_9ASTR|nr:hypothetical protein OSB04_013936 [Centaurea solstitialis]
MSRQSRPRGTKLWLATRARCWQICASDQSGEDRHLLNKMTWHYPKDVMPWVGLYVAVASFICTIAMIADVFHDI